MIVKLYQIGKRENSTQQPTNSDPTHEISSCYLKEDCSVMRPVIRVGWPVNSAVSIHVYNYAYIPLFQRYYWVRDWVNLNNGMWEGDLEVDVLASFKTKIGLERHYILRANTRAYTDGGSSVAVADGSLIDSIYPSKTDFIYDRSNINSNFAINFSQGTFILGIINNASSAGAVTYYAMTAAQMGAFKAYMLGDPSDYMQSSAGGIWDLDVNEPTIKALFNPFQYVVSCLWFPLSTAQLKITGTGGSGTLVNSIRCGWWEIGVSAYAAFDLSTVVKITDSASITAHPQAIVPETTSTDPVYRYLNYPPYSRYYIQLPPFGNMELDGNMCGNYLGSVSSQLVHFQMTVDMITGQAYLYTVDSNESASPLMTHLIEVNTQLAIPIQMGQITSNTGEALVTAWDAATNTAGNLLSILGGNAMGAARAVGSMAHGILDSIAASSPHLSTMGTQGGLAAFRAPHYLLSQHFKRVETDHLENGYPVCKTMLINRLAGYILCRNADPKIAGATLEELHQIKAFLDGGFFYE